jgi:transketolase
MDYNNLQQYAFENNTIINPIYRWQSFGWNVDYIDGHNFNDIINSFNNVVNSNKPTIIIADTIKGRGISFMEGQKSWHSRIPTPEEYKLAILELEELK